MENKKTRAFVFTHNNYESKHIERYKQFKCTYICFGLEIGEEKGTPHIQGYVYFPNPRYWEPTRKLFPGADVRPAKGTPAECYNYCAKMCDFFEKGQLPMSDDEKGEAGRQSWENVKALAIAGDLASIPGRYYVPFYRTLKQIADDHYKPDIDCDIMYKHEWQVNICDILDKPADKRKIMWVWSEQGGVGKSTFARYLVKYYAATLLNNAKSQDIAYSLPRDPKVVIFDLSRSMEGHINYDIIEQIKNGVVFSAKYESRTKYFKSPHVIIFANYEPNKAAWSQDRYFIIKLD